MSLTMLLLLAVAVLSAVLVIYWKKRDTEDVYHVRIPDVEATDADANEVPDEEEVPSDDEEESIPTRILRAEVLSSCRSMDPLGLKAASLVTFRNEEGDECTLYIPGEGGLFLRAGDQGTLTTAGDTFLTFEKDGGEVIGATFYLPASVQE